MCVDLRRQLPGLDGSGGPGIRIMNPNPSLEKIGSKRSKLHRKLPSTTSGFTSFKHPNSVKVVLGLECRRRYRACKWKISRVGWMPTTIGVSRLTRWTCANNGDRFDSNLRRNHPVSRKVLHLLVVICNDTRGTTPQRLSRDELLPHGKSTQTVAV